MTELSDLLSMDEYLTYDDVLLLPNYSEVRPSKTDLSTQLSSTIRLLTPIISSPMDTVTEYQMAKTLAQLGGLGIIHRNLSIEQQAAQVKKVIEEDLVVGAAIGVGDDFDERVKQLVSAGVRILCIDSSHGHTKHVVEATSDIKKRFPKVQLISGNVATYEGAKALFTAGADVVRVGMGPGSICTTRVMSGMGVPQLTAVLEGVRAAREFKRHIIADGGIKTSGDIVKALAAGASTVMLGSLLAGTDEAPGDVIQVGGKMYKSYRGMGSVAAMKEGSAARYGQTWKKGQTKNLVPEGVEGLVPHRGGLEDHLHQMLGGLRSGLAYLGAHNVEELAEKAKFIRISRAGVHESSPHSILVQ